MTAADDPAAPSAASARPPRGLFITTDLMFFSRVAQVAGERSWRLLSLSSVDELLYRASEEPAALVLIDLETRDLDLAETLAELRALPTPPAAIVAYGPHVHEALLQQARDGGCDEVLSRGKFAAQLADVLGRYLSAG